MCVYAWEEIVELEVDRLNEINRPGFYEITRGEKYELGISSFYSKVCASRCWKLIQYVCHGYLVILWLKIINSETIGFS